MRSALHCLVAAVFLAGCTAAPGGGSDFPDMDRVKAASDASQCVKVDSTICPCSNGGDVTAINEQYADRWHTWLERQRAEQDDVVCATVYNCRDDADIVIENGECTLKGGNTTQIPTESPR